MFMSVVMSEDILNSYSWCVSLKIIYLKTTGGVRILCYFSIELSMHTFFSTSN